MNFLAAILEEKAAEVAARREGLPVESMRNSASFVRPCVSLASALCKGSFNVIAEVKRASPSRGLIRQDFDPVSISRAYVEAGACAVSVLTDSRFFQGSIAHLEEVRTAVAVPILRKDFIIHPYQLYESRHAGADAVLLIVAALGRSQLTELRCEAQELGLECLVEVHSEEELRTAIECGARLIGINNRDLRTFAVNVNTTLRLAPLVPPDAICVSESGITGRSDLAALVNAGVRAVLIGEAFMREPDPGDALRRFLAVAEEVA
ncbi:MAG: indole-3-glycerol phosphate synthase TrpC [Bacteroidota bacterium]